MLDAENLREHASNYLYWFDRAVYYRLEHEELQEDDYHRASRSVTSEVAYPGAFGFTEINRAKCEAGIVARMLAD